MAVGKSVCTGDVTTPGRPCNWPSGGGTERVPCTTPGMAPKVGHGGSGVVLQAASMAAVASMTDARRQRGCPDASDWSLKGGVRTAPGSENEVMSCFFYQ